MEFLVLTCADCPRTFYTANEYAEHHLEAHERPLPLHKEALLRQNGLTSIGRSYAVIPEEHDNEHHRH